MRRDRWGRLVGLVGAGLLGLALLGMGLRADAHLADGGNTGVIHACLDNESGKLKIVKPLTSCQNDETARAARYSGQVYKSSYDLCLYLEQVVARFSRTHRYSIGADLREGARRVLRLVVRANARRDKVPVLLELREELEDLKVLVRLGHDTKAFANLKGFEHAMTLLSGIAKQTEEWLKHQRQGHGQNRGAMPEGLANRRSSRRSSPILGSGLPAPTAPRQTTHCRSLCTGSSPRNPLTRPPDRSGA